MLTACSLCFAGKAEELKNAKKIIIKII